MLLMRASNLNLLRIAEIHDALATRVEAWFGAGARLEVASAELRKYPNSFMVRVPAIDEKSRPVVLVKIPRKSHHQMIDEALLSEKMRENTRAHYDFMVLTHRVFENVQDSHCFAIRPLGYLERWNAIAMLEAEGQTLTEMLFWGVPPQNREFFEHLENAARWLRIYYEQIGELSMEMFSSDTIKNQVDTLLANLFKYSHGAVDVAPIRISLLSMIMDNREVPVARVHDDYKYSNVLISAEGRACGFDFPRRVPSRKPIYADLASLMSDPETRIACMLTGGFFLSSRFLVQARRSILKGYFDGDPHDDVVFDFYCAIAVLTKWMEVEKRLSYGTIRFVGLILRPWARLYFSSLLQRYFFRCCAQS
jgi:hypothetical protein